VIAAYLRATDADAAVACFTTDAEVVDEGATRHGHDEIGQWRKETSAAYDYTVTVLGWQPAGDDYVVRTRVVGNFSGGTVDLAYRFALRDGLISTLRIQP
jgi:hypothetical protein